MGILIGLALLVSGILIVNSGDSKGLEWSSSWRNDISVKNGISDPEISNGEFIIDKTGEYTVHLTWEPYGIKPEDLREDQLGFLTLCELSDNNGHLLFSADSLAGYYSPTLSLKKGNYHLVYRYLTNEEDYRSYEKPWAETDTTTQDNSDGYHFLEFQRDGTWTMEYGLHATEEVPFSITMVCGLLAVIIGLTILVLVLVTIVKSKGYMRQKYDERQELEQGRGYRYAFFASLVSFAAALMIDMMGLLPDRKGSIFYAAGIFIGISVYVVYCIWHDCYIALNEKRWAVTVFLTVIGLINLLLGILVANSKGLFDDDGRYNPCVLNLMCAGMSFVVVIALLIRILTESRNAREEGEDEA